MAYFKDADTSCCIQRTMTQLERDNKILEHIQQSDLRTITRLKERVESLEEINKGLLGTFSNPVDRDKIRSLESRVEILNRANSDLQRQVNIYHRSLWSPSQDEVSVTGTLALAGVLGLILYHIL